jgi:rubrerythrin
MYCPNFKLCDNRNNKYNGVCYECDNAIYGYFNKKQTLSHRLYPTIYSHPESFKEYKKWKLNKETYKELLKKLENNRLNTGILNIVEMIKECPICYENKSDVFIYHPTCNLHLLCKECFKNTFLDGHIEDKDIDDDKKDFEIINNYNNRQCPICRESKLII